ncbi:hypothetical protein Tco_0030962 [Tanacetum coccineum]
MRNLKENFHAIKGRYELGDEMHYLSSEEVKFVKAIEYRKDSLGVTPSNNTPSRNNSKLKEILGKNLEESCKRQGVILGVWLEYKPQGRKEKEGQEEEIRLEKRVWEAYTYNNENLHPSPSVVKGYLYPFALSEAYGLLNGSGLASRGLLACYIDNIGLMSKPVDSRNLLDSVSSSKRRESDFDLLEYGNAGQDTGVKMAMAAFESQYIARWKRISDKRTKNKAKNDKTEHGMKKREKTKSNQSQSQQKSKSTPTKSTVKTDAEMKNT